MDKTITRKHLALGAAALLCLLVVPIAAAGAAGGSGGPEATASASVKKQVKKLKKKVKKLQQQVEEVSKQPGPQGPAGQQGVQGEQGPPGTSTGPAGGDLTGNYPDPSIAGGAVNSAKVANGSLTGIDILDGSLGTADLAGGAVTNPKLANGAVNSAKVANNSLTGADIDESSLNAPAMGCQTTLIHGFARIKGSTDIPIEPVYSNSSAHIDRVFNCTGGGVSVSRDSLFGGVYLVRFGGGNPATFAFATTQTPPDLLDGENNIVAVYRDEGPDRYNAPTGDFVVTVRDSSGAREHGWSSILLP